MQKIHKTALVPYTDQQMYQLVNDIKSYPLFMPWCSGTEIIECSSSHMIARVDIAFASVHQSFTTRNICVSPTSIKMELVDGPFSFLEGQWSFQSLSDEACKVILDLNYHFNHSALSLLIAPVFHKISSTMVSSFVKRADALYTSYPCEK